VAYESNHVPHDSKEFLCAKKTDDPAKLVVAPCFLPDWRGWFSGDYVNLSKFFLFLVDSLL
jgi:hypothetical protein